MATYKITDAGGNVVATFVANSADQVAVFKYNPAAPAGAFLSQFRVPTVAPPPAGAGLPDLNPSPAGTFGDGAKVPRITVNAKGLVTAVDEVAIEAIRPEEEQV